MCVCIVHADSSFHSFLGVLVILHVHPPPSVNTLVQAVLRELGLLALSLVNGSGSKAKSGVSNIQDLVMKEMCVCMCGSDHYV